MKRVLVSELKRAFINPVMIAVICIEFVIVILYTAQEVLPVCYVSNPFLYSMVYTGKVDGIRGAYYTWIGFNHSQCRTILYSILPLLAALPYGASLYNDEKRRYVENVLIRCKRREYYMSKFIAMFMSGGAVAAFPFLLSIIINALFLPFETIVPELFWISLKNNEILADLFYNAPLLYITVFIIMTFVMYGCLNCLCFPASYIFANGFVIMAVPFSIYYGSFVVLSFLGNKSASLWLSMRFNYMMRNDLAIIITTFGVIAAVELLVLLIRSGKHSDII